MDPERLLRRLDEQLARSESQEVSAPTPPHPERNLIVKQNGKHSAAPPGPGRPRLFGKPLKVQLGFRVTEVEHALLRRAADEGVEGATSIADVVRQAMAYYFARHPEAKKV